MPDNGLSVHGLSAPGDEDVLSPGALEFLALLAGRFEPERRALLARRAERQKQLSMGIQLALLPETREIRGGAWHVPPPPPDLADRRVEITGPAEAKRIINALNSGAQVFMADFEDSCSPTWNNLMDGQRHLMAAIRRTLQVHAETKIYTMQPQTATLMVRPRGWHLVEKHVTFQGEPLSASLMDFGLFFFHNAHELLKRGSGPYFYLPKLESHLEARLWNDVFDLAQEALGIPRGTIRATVLIETVPAAFEMPEILFALGPHALGLNAGRWDYLFSLIKTFRDNSRYTLPDRTQLTMDVPFMAAYASQLVSICHRHEAQAIGGMAAFVPNRQDPTATKLALEKVREDKEREAKAGFDGTWVAHPDLVPVALEAFSVSRKPSPASSTTDLLDLRIPGAQVTEKGIRTNLSVALQYLAAWLDGNGAVAINNLMEDVATAEICRAQLWQWRQHGAKLADGRQFDAPLYQQLKLSELSKLSTSSRLTQAAELLDRLVLSDRFIEFLTLPAYELLDAETIRVDPQVRQLEREWSEPRWQGIQRDYTAAEVVRLRPTLVIAHTLAQASSIRLWQLLQTEPFLRTYGAMTGAQAVQMVKAGLKALYISGWQVAADANLAGQTYPDQSLYPSNSVPALVRRINNALMRADQIHRQEGKEGVSWYAPMIADAEAGFGGAQHAFELTKALIEAGAGGVHFEDQLASEKKCGHMGGKVLVPVQQFILTLKAARLAADVLGVPTVLIARTDALDATLLTSDVDPRDRPFLTGERTSEGYFVARPGLEGAIARALAYAPYADLLWCETSTPDLDLARRFASAIHAMYPGKLLAYNCSPSFNWKKHLDDATIMHFQEALAEMGYKFQFITLAGWHSLNYHAFDLAQAYAQTGMPAYVDLQTREFAAADKGYCGARHQREVGTGYFDHVLRTLTQGNASTMALDGSTEATQFQDPR